MVLTIATIVLGLFLGRGFICYLMVFCVACFVPVHLKDNHTRNLFRFLCGFSFRCFALMYCTSVTIAVRLEIEQKRPCLNWTDEQCTTVFRWWQLSTRKLRFPVDWTKSTWSSHVHTSVLHICRGKQIKEIKPVLLIHKLKSFDINLSFTWDQLSVHVDTYLSGKSGLCFLIKLTQNHRLVCVKAHYASWIWIQDL